MPQTSFAILTNLGRAKEAAALANATTITITHIAIGDGATVPSGGETALYHEIARKTISGHGTVVGADNVAYFDCYLAAGDGPYTIREAGLYDNVGDLIAIAHYDPPINKPVPSSGQTVEGTVRLEVAFSNIATVVIVVDPSMQVALQRLTRLPWIPIIELNRNAPPSSPAVGDSYVIGPSPTGSWAGNAGKVAEFTIAGWAMMTSPAGHGVSTPDGRVYEKVSGSYVEKIALDVQSGKWIWAVDAGVTNALFVTLDPVPISLTPGMELRVLVLYPNTGAATIKVKGVDYPIVRQDGGPLIKGELLGNEIASLIFDGTRFRKMGLPIVTVLAAPRTYYVNCYTGSNGNDGATPSSAFATIQYAVDVVSRLDANGYAVTISVADGVYAPFTVFNAINGVLLVVGNNGTPSNCLVDGGYGASSIAATGSGTIFSVEGFMVRNLSGFGHGVVAQGGGCTVRFRNIDFGIMGTGEHIFCDQGNVFCYGDYIVSGSARYHICAQTNGMFTLSPTFVNNVTHTGTPNFTAYAYAKQAGLIRANPSTTFSGTSCTGSKWLVTTMSLIDTDGGGVNFFPGNAAGSGNTGGYYA